MINNLRVRKDTVEETYTVSSTIFETKTGHIQKDFLSTDIKLLMRFTISASGMNEINKVKNFIEENIKGLIIQPIYSTKLTSDQTVEDDTIIIDDDYNKMVKIGDYILSGETLNELQSYKIISILNDVITTESNMDIDIGDMIMIGREMSVGSKVGINRISNTYHNFNVSMEEL